MKHIVGTPIDSLPFIAPHSEPEPLEDFSVTAVPNALPDTPEVLDAPESSATGRGFAYIAEVLRRGGSLGPVPGVVTARADTRRPDMIWYHEGGDTLSIFDNTTDGDRRETLQPTGHWRLTPKIR